EGNPEAPLFGGGTCAAGQATVLSLYDGQRLRQPHWHGTPVSWQEIDETIESQLRTAMASRGRVVLLSRTVNGPATRSIVAGWSAGCAGFRHIMRESASCSAIRHAHETCFKQAVVPHYRFDEASLIVGLEADFLGTWLSPVEFTAQYVRRRQPMRTMA